MLSRQSPVASVPRVPQVVLLPGRLDHVTTGSGLGTLSKPYTSVSVAVW